MMRNHRILRLGIAAVFLLLGASQARADIYAEQDCVVTQNSNAQAGLTPLSINKGEVYYQRKIFIRDGFMAFQIVVDRVVTKEIGFDLAQGIYYEAEPPKNEFRRYTLERIRQDFAMLKMEAVSKTDQGGLDLFEAIAGGREGKFTDYRIEPKKALFGGKEILGLKCDLYKYKIFTGGAGLFNSQSESNLEIWTTDQIPSYAEYQKLVEGLKDEAGFYKAKTNEISDFILAMISVKGFPAGITAKKRSAGMMGGMSIDVNESLSFIQTRPLNTAELFYFKDQARFSTNLRIEQEDVSAPSSLASPTQPSYKPVALPSAQPKGFLGIIETRGEALYSILIPVLLVLGGIWRWYNRETIGFQLSFRGVDLSGYYVIIIVLFALDIIHAIFSVPYLFTRFIEFTMVIFAGLGVIQIERRLIIKRAYKMAEAGRGQVCPKCKNFVEKLLASCPFCKQKL